MSDDTVDQMTLEEALMLASLATRGMERDPHRIALHLLGREYHKQQLYLIKLGHKVRKLQRGSV